MYELIFITDDNAGGTHYGAPLLWNVGLAVCEAKTYTERVFNCFIRSAGE